MDEDRRKALYDRTVEALGEAALTKRPVLIVEGQITGMYRWRYWAMPHGMIREERIQL
jgi:hypothetical protein